MLTTTLAEIRSHGPCESGFAKIRDHFGVSAAEAKTHSEPFPIALLLETNGLDDTLWVAAHVAPDAITRFLIRRLDEGEYSALKTLRALDGDYARQIEAVEEVVSLLRRKLADEDVTQELHIAAAAADVAARATYAAHAAARDAVYAAARATYAAARAARAAVYAAANVAADVAAHAAVRAAACAVVYAVADARAVYAAAHAAARDDLRQALQSDNARTNGD